MRRRKGVVFTETPHPHGQFSARGKGKNIRKNSLPSTEAGWKSETLSSSLLGIEQRCLSSLKPEKVR
jgi:hypothetical protein